LITGCSYVTETLEKDGSTRAKFSIKASYDASTNYLTISWSPKEVGERFAGYEVYMILEPWNEFGTYQVIAACYNINPKAHFFREISWLGSPYITSVQIPVTPEDLNGEGEYYVRLGIISITSKDKDGNYYPSTFENYVKYSRSTSISGYQAVHIY